MRALQEEDMPRKFALVLVIGAFAAAGWAVGRAVGAEVQHHDGGTALRVPQSIQAEHAEIHEALVELTRAPGSVGVAAKALAATLEPHFKREEEIALPPLGLLAPLAEGKSPDGMREAAAMAATLREEMPRMLREHAEIRAAIERLERAARDARHAEGVAFAEKLALHARTEEEVLYPAAILVGDIIRARTAGR
jgi:hypothetical protein